LARDTPLHRLALHLVAFVHAEVARVAKSFLFMPVKQAWACDTSDTLAAVPTTLCTSPESASTPTSGSGSALLRHRPLRTGRASRPASGSSHSSAPSDGTGQSTIGRGSTTGKVRRPRRVKGICLTTYLHVPNNWNHRGSEQPNYSTGFGPRGKRPSTMSLYVEVFVLHPTRAFRGMPTHSPFP
jgi:hypothetical protein